MLITQTPLRISLAGGGTDIPSFYRKESGAVVNSAIDKYIYVIVKERFDEKIVLGYSQREMVDSVDEIRHELVRESMRKTGVGSGVEVVTLADVPSEGSGLGSSSSVTVGLLNALYAYQGVQVTPSQLAKEACEIEIDICGKPIGKQDQYIAAFGGLCFFQFHPDEQVEVDRLHVGKQRRDLSGRLLLFYTDITRKADTVLEAQAQNMEKNQSHAKQIRDLAFRAKDAVVGNRLDEVGLLLKDNWALKKEMAHEITNPRINTMVEIAMSNGATGCKICGAGGGGFLLVYCEPELQNELRRAMNEYRELPFFLERHGSRVIFNVEGYEWK